MKLKIILLFLALGMLNTPNSDAQILKKIKDKVSTVTRGKKKEKDSIPDGNEGPQRPEMTEEERQQENEKMSNFFGGGLEEIRDTYSFSYSLVYELTTSKESMPLEYLLEPEADYFANITGDEKTEQLMVYDFKKNAMVMFMENEGQKMAMKMKMPNAKKMQKKFGKKIIPDEKEEEVDIVPIKGKTILGYQCDGYQVTSKDGVGQFWVTNEAPVTINEVFANFKSLPKKARNYPLSVKSLILEMNYTAKRGKKDNMKMLATQLVENPIEINKKDYNSGY
jgi:hypothetical protein